MAARVNARAAIGFIVLEEYNFKRSGPNHHTIEVEGGSSLLIRI
jgi:hypothetical protein